MSAGVFKILDLGVGATLQDLGRFGWRRFGVPASGPMDDHAAAWANRLLENPPDAPVLELLLRGAKLAVLEDAWIAVTGADAQANVPSWRAIRVKAGETIYFARHRSGVWSYLAVESGFEAKRILGSASSYERGQLGPTFARGDVLHRARGSSFQLQPRVAGRSVAWDERRAYELPPDLRVWPGPQWDAFAESDRQAFFEWDWTVTPQCDRVGYRLAGVPLKPDPSQMISEPVRVGTIQVPANGQPIVIMRDGPTVGGYPKLGMVDSSDLSWLAQCQPGKKVRFRQVE